MKILVLHGIENNVRIAKNVVDLELSIANYLKNCDIIFHCYKHPFYPALADLDYDGIIIWSTFLDARHHPETYTRVRQEFDFITQSSAIKIALPQDEYYCNELLDQWMVDWNINCLYTVLYEYKNDIFPQYLKSEGQIRYGYTGYINKFLLEKSSKQNPLQSRSIDVSYRASGVPTNLNQLASLKAQIGDNFKREFGKYKFDLDISVKPQDFISGSDWYSFIEDSKFVLGVNSGSSVRIPNLEMTQEIREFRESNRDAKYEDIVSKFLKPEYENFYTAISPRNIEAALLGSCQITTDLGSYSNLLFPGESFISIKPDCSNHKEVSDQMKDKDLVKKIVKNCREVILSCSGLRLEKLYLDLEELIKEGKNTKDIIDFSFLKVKARHHLFIKRFLINQKWKNWKTYNPIANKIKKTINYKSINIDE